MTWNKGDRVVQATYGPGTVLDVNDQHTTIHFDNAGRRRFATHLVVLEATGAASLPKMSHGSGQASESTTTAGYKNPNRQVVLRQTNLSGNLAGQRLYVLMCGDCGREYGANGCDIHLRKCPGCMDGQPGLDY
jgi:hypothetical protein